MRRESVFSNADNPFDITISRAAEPQTGPGPEQDDVDSADEATMLLHWAREEIRSLRCEIGRLAPKAEAYDLLLSFSQIIPGKPMGYGEDLAWEIERFLNPETRMGQTS